MTDRRVRVHADDLSGAAEAAARFARAGVGPVPLRLAGGPSPVDVAVHDLDTRQLDPATAEARARSALAEAGDALVMTKLDSLLRGNLAAHLRALLPAPVVLAPSLPATGRTVVDGVPLVDGLPLAASAYSRTWARDGAAPPATVGELLTGIPHRHAELTSIRAGVVPAVSGSVLVCDAVTDDDLDLIVGATWDVPGIRYAGSAGLAGAVARRVGTAAPAAPHEPGPARGVLFVVGTTEPAADRQLRELAAPVVTVPSGPHDPDEYAGAVAARLRDHAAVVLRTEPIATTRAAPAAAAGLGTVVALVPAMPDLVLTGGQTARAVLHALGVDELTVESEIHHGAVLSRTPDGRTVVTRPGSFGPASSFADILGALRPTPREAAHPAATLRKATTS